MKNFMYAVLSIAIWVCTATAQISETKLVARDGAPYDFLGQSVSLSGDYALIGANQDDDNGSASGSAYLFHYDGLNWLEQTKLTARDGGEGDYFGTAVSLSGDYALVGAYGDDDNGTDAGAAYIFHYGLYHAWTACDHACR